MKLTVIIIPIKLEICDTDMATTQKGYKDDWDDENSN